MSDHKRLTDVLFKLFALHQFLAAHKKYEWAVWRAQHTVDFIDSDIAVLSGFLSPSHFTTDIFSEKNRGLLDKSENKSAPGLGKSGSIVFYGYEILENSKHSRCPYTAAK